VYRVDPRAAGPDPRTRRAGAAAPGRRAGAADARILDCDERRAAP